MQSITGLANALNEKITSVDNFHMLITEIEQGMYDYDNVIASLFAVIAQIDRRMASDDRKMNILQNALAKKGYLNDDERPLFEYMNMVAALPENVAGTVYYEFFCLNGNNYADMFTLLMDRYDFLPKMEKKSKKVDMMIREICDNLNEDSDTTFSTNEIYEYFIESKKDYLLSIQEAKVVGVEANVVNAPAQEIQPKPSAPQDYDNMSFDEIKRLAEQGDAEAMCRLGICYLNGESVDKNYISAFEWFKKSAKLGCVDAMNRVGVRYFQGQGTSQNNEEAFKWFKQAAEKGHIKAMDNLADCYYNGDGIEQNYSAAFEWYKKAADLGYDVAMVHLGNCYHYGYGVDKDENVAFEWYKKAAELGNETAMEIIKGNDSNSNGVIIIGPKGTKKKGLGKLIQFCIDEGYASELNSPIVIVDLDSDVSPESMNDLLSNYEENIWRNRIVVFIDSSNAVKEYGEYSYQTVVSTHGSFVKVGIRLVLLRSIDTILIHGNLDKALSKYNKGTLDVYDDDMECIRHKLMQATEIIMAILYSIQMIRPKIIIHCTTAMAKKKLKIL